MQHEVEIEDHRVDLARQLAEQLKVNNEEKANHLLSELTLIRHESLYCEVGKLTRDLHGMLNNAP